MNLLRRGAKSLSYSADWYASGVCRQCAGGGSAAGFPRTVTKMRSSSSLKWMRARAMLRLWMSAGIGLCLRGKRWLIDAVCVCVCVCGKRLRVCLRVKCDLIVVLSDI